MREVLVAEAEEGVEEGETVGLRTATQDVVETMAGELVAVEYAILLGFCIFILIVLSTAPSSS